MQVRFIRILYSLLGLLFYSLYLILDTKCVMGGKSLRGYEFTHDEYIFAAVMLYVDILMIFLYLLDLA